MSTENTLVRQHAPLFPATRQRRVPLVVLPTTVQPAGKLNARVARDLQDAVSTLHAVRSAITTDCLRKQEDRTFAAAIQAMRRLALSTAPVRSQIDDESRSESIPVHQYFGVVSRFLTGPQQVVQAANILFRTLADHRFAFIDLNDIDAEIAAMVLILDHFRTTLVPVADSAKSTSVAAQFYEPSDDGLERWFFTHHAYFLFNIYAAHCVSAATSSIVKGNPDRAAELLQQAVVYVRGFSAAMMHSGAVSSGYYRDVIRPTMSPPAVPVVLTGTMQPEHALFRAALESLLRACNEPFITLVHQHRTLALARDQLLEADLMDIERHICVASALVGNDHSLVQSDSSPGNAVSALRRMRHERASRYCPMMRFGDPVTIRA